MIKFAIETNLNEKQMVNKSIHISEEFVSNLDYQWSGEIEQHNGQIISIWWTAWAMRKGKIKRVVNVYSDLPKIKI